VAAYLPTYTGNLTAGNVVTTGNVTSSYFIGDGSQLTGLPAGYTNANVAAYLPTYTGNLTAGNVVTTGNVTSSYFIGDGSQLTGLPASYTNANVAAYLPTYTGNLTAGNVVASGNITANYFIGNGSQLTGIFTSQASFAKYKRTTAQTGIVVNSAVICNVSEAFSGADISVNTTTGSITLQPNKTYRLRGTVGDALRITAGTACNINFQWYNVTAGALLGTDTFYISPSSTTSEFFYSGTAEAVFTPTVTTVVQLRITDFSNIDGIGNALSAQSFPWIDIEVIGGANPYTTSSSLANGTSNINIATPDGNITMSVAGGNNFTLSSSNLFIDPIRNDTGNVTNAVYYNTTTKEITYGPGGGGSYGNSNVASYLPTYTGNLVSLTGNVTTTANINGVNFNASGNAVITGNTSSGNLAVGNVATTGNIIMNGGKISGFSATAPATLQHYAETAIAGGNLTGTLAINTTLGTIQRYTLTGSITINGFVNAVAGTNATLILKQDATGGRTLTSTMKFLGGVKTLSTAANAIDVLSVFYDGTDYLATLGKGYA
jgi:hypothetical protein